MTPVDEALKISQIKLDNRNQFGANKDKIHETKV